LKVTIYSLDKTIAVLRRAISCVAKLMVNT
jgi:hypothetical protein